MGCVVRILSSDNGVDRCVQHRYESCRTGDRGEHQKARNGIDDALM
jgi:hypothetical protein